MTGWNESLRAARERLRLSRRALAGRSGVSADTIGSYEYGRRAPTPRTLERLARALDLDPDGTERLLTAAGFPSPPSDGVLREVRTRRPSPASLMATVREYPWPCLVLNERFEMVAWNGPAERVAELDFAAAAPTPRARNLMRLASDPHFRWRAKNWEEIVGYFLGLLKLALPDLASGNTPDPYFVALVQDIAREFPDSLDDLMRLWQAAAPLPPGLPNIYHPVWRTSDGALLRFNAVVTTGSDFDAFFANDWHPADAETWEWLAATRDSAAHAPDDEPALEDWHALLRRARAQSGFTRRALAARACISTRALDNYETGRRKPERETLLRLARTLRLDGATTNIILTAAEFEPEPSDWARVLAGQPPPTFPGHYGPRIPSTLDELRETTAGHPWPCLILGPDYTITGANPAARRVLAEDMPAIADEPGRRHLVRFLLSRATRARILNWEEAAAALFPSTLWRVLAGAGAPPALQAALDELAAEDPGALDDLRALSQRAPAPILTSRTVVPLRWQHADRTALAFHAVLNPPIGDAEPWVIDWHPAEAATWHWLGRHASQQGVSYTRARGGLDIPIPLRQHDVQ